MTLSEVLLWKKLRNKALGYDFDRQKPLGNYIVDFYCKELKLVLEIDGNSHNNTDAYLNDLKRQTEIENFGVTFLRFQDIEIKQNINQVIYSIQNWINQNTHPCPSQEGIRGNGSYNLPDINDCTKKQDSE